MYKKCIHHCLIHNHFTTLKFFFTLPIHSSPQPLVTSDLFTVSIIFPFPKWHIAGIIQYVVFQIHFFHSNMHLSSLHVFSWLHNISFQCWIIILQCVDVIQLNNITPSCRCSTVHSTTKGHLRCFQLLAIMNKNNIGSLLFKSLHNMSDLIMDIAAYE